ncbi:MAG TPA: RagB/SusD family nutrient uptake outer membrane protein [Gemmatimonadaceae bacterium]|nr:RagB/SusD family nutrient uptake outer membrane protein [Gemmatimonadaceae bacterium]
MRFKLLMLSSAVLFTACSSVLDVPPTSSVPSDIAINDAIGARAALAGAYQALQAGGSYGHRIIDWTELLSDNMRFTGTFDDYADAEVHQLRSDNFTDNSIWVAMYDGINRANQILKHVPDVADLSAGEKDEILGEAYFLRALQYHNLVRMWGEVPLRLEPVTNAVEAGQITKSTVAAVYTQILADLAQAEQLITNDSDTRQATIGAAYAIEARVRLYQQDWAGAEAAAATVESMGYSLAPEYADLFDATGNDTPEDIFRITFLPTQSQLVSFYFLPKPFGGRYEVAPAPSILIAYDPASNGTQFSTYHPTDERGIYNISLQGTSRIYASKFRNPSGDEDLHVIRLGEVILIRAEALAHLARFPEALAEANRLRVRAGVAALPTVGGTLASVTAAVAKERRLELAFEGDRWPDMVRTGEALLQGVPAFQTLLPIPQRELDTAPLLTQNQGY